MLKSIISVCTIACVVTANAMANSNNEAQQATSPVPAVEVGKVKLISIKELSPTVANLVQKDMQTNALGKARSYGEISDDAVFYKKNYYANLKDMREINKNLTFKLSDLSRSELGTYRFEGAYPEGPTKTGPWSSLTKVFKRDDGVIVMLHEWDYIGDGGGIMMVRELMNTQVADTPARFSVLKSPTGSVVSQLIWATEKKYFTLTVMDEVADADDVKYNVKWLTSLASSIK